MQAPPEQPQTEPAKKGPNIILIVLIAVLVLSCCCIGGLAAVLFPAFNQARQAARTNVCETRLEQVATATMIYAIDHDDRLPLADNWMDAIDPYIESQAALTCPGGPGRYGYAFNREFSGANLETIPQPEGAILIFDSVMAARNAASGIDTMPNPPRHNGVNYAVFANGMVLPVDAQGRPAFDTGDYEN
jgi:hypothetical protein